MRKAKMALVTILILSLSVLIISTLATTAGVDSPYICTKCDQSFSAEGSFVNHMDEIHGRSLLIDGMPPVPGELYYNVEDFSYTPVLFYLCPETGQRFLIEAQFCWHLENI